MAAWKQQLRRDAAGEGHRLTPITRVSSKLGGRKLAEQTNEYHAQCTHCGLQVQVNTFPGIPARILMQRNGRSSDVDGPISCNPARSKAAHTRSIARTAATQQEEGSNATA